MLDGLVAVADEIERDDACRVVILTGDGPKAFCAGADIAEWGELGPLEFGRRWVGEGHRVFDRWARLRQPVIAMLNGIAFGGGLELAATADYRLAEAHARVGLPESQVGIVPGWSGTQRLVRRAGSPAVKRLVLTGEPVDAAEALRLGLVDEVVPTGEGMARARAGGDDRERGRRWRCRSPSCWSTPPRARRPGPASRRSPRRSGPECRRARGCRGVPRQAAAGVAGSLTGTGR